jgi:transketolase
VTSKTFEPELQKLAVNTIRMLAVDTVQKANSGHPGMPMGMADCAFILWSRFLKFNPKDPDWPNRDRFILSAGHGSALLYSLLCLAGFDVTLEDLKNFRQWQSRTPGHPEYGELSGIETTTGPLGQGFANGVGMAVAEKIMKKKFNTNGFSPVDHHIYAIVSDGDLMEGIASEAASIAGHLGLGNIIYLYDDNQITIEGKTNLAFSEDVEKRFQAYGWHTIKIDGHNHEEIAHAIEEGILQKECPTLILSKTHIGFGSPNKQDTAGVHGAPLGEEEVVKTKENLGWPSESGFYIPEEVKILFKKRILDLQKEYDVWQNEYKKWKAASPDLAMQWDSMHNKTLPDNLEEQLIEALPDKPTATRNIGGKILNKAAKLLPGLYGGSADLAPSTKTLIEDSDSIGPAKFKGRNFHFGIREHAMGGILNGIALYGGYIPYGSTFLVFSDYMRPSIRLAALMKAQVVYVFTHDSIFVGEDGPTHQPVEHVAALRVIPNVDVFRPADGLETAMAWAYAIRKKNGPTALCLSRQTLPILDRPAGFDPKLIQKGGYIISTEKDSKPDVVLVASGSEVEVALNGKTIIQTEGKSVRIVSMPSLDVFMEQPLLYRNSIIPEKEIPVVIVEAGVSQGWHALTGAPVLFLGMNRFGASAPYKVLAEKFGFTGEAVAERTLQWLKNL